MVLPILLLALVIWAVVATFVELRRDGYRPTPTDWSRVAGQDALSQADPGHVYR
ncbi:MULTISPECIES: hypothetical protein [Microbacterium]|jgi:hypothetical protein|uniref:Uncharacterized protein n=1 Tax=Microbacterium paraoxydans TaxID=199592 RepID=A0A1H1RWU4_9MICO|nr:MULTISPECIES: hypothetical protein [Microbacterium]MCK2033025.1 hypothetical protein [Microbacterium sp. KSW4-4]MCT2225607.1 hypothetical protein [Microbacterium paraoxydans]SDS40202.1 hypothetical protein SAMN04489809_1775 [Microbacterium paraoxydans]